MPLNGVKNTRQMENISMHSKDGSLKMQMMRYYFSYGGGSQMELGICDLATYAQWYLIPLRLNGNMGFRVYNWCEEHTSNGRFVATIQGWYFERRADALFFSLKWSTE